MSESDPHSREPLTSELDGRIIMPEDDKAFYQNGSEAPHKVTPWVDHVRDEAERDGVYDDESPWAALGGGTHESAQLAQKASADQARQADHKIFEQQFGLSGRPESGSVEIPESVKGIARKATIDTLTGQGFSKAQIIAILRARDERKKS